MVLDSCWRIFIPEDAARANPSLEKCGGGRLVGLVPSFTWRINPHVWQATRGMAKATVVARLPMGSDRNRRSTCPQRG